MYFKCLFLWSFDRHHLSEGKLELNSSGRVTIYTRHGINIIGFLVSFDFVNLNLNLILLSDVSGQIIPPIPKKIKKLHGKKIAGEQIY